MTIAGYCFFHLASNFPVQSRKNIFASCRSTARACNKRHIQVRLYGKDFCFLDVYGERTVFEVGTANIFRASFVIVDWITSHWKLIISRHLIHHAILLFDRNKLEHTTPSRSPKCDHDGRSAILSTLTVRLFLIVIVWTLDIGAPLFIAGKNLAASL